METFFLVEYRVPRRRRWDISGTCGHKNFPRSCIKKSCIVTKLSCRFCLYNTNIQLLNVLVQCV